MNIRPTTELKRRTPDALLAGLIDPSESVSKESGMKLMQEVRSFGMDLPDFLRLAIDVRSVPAESRGKYTTGEGKLLNGYEAALTYLNLPVKDDLDGGVMLQAAADTFNTYPGTRAMFPPVIDDMVRWRYHQTTYESTAGMVGQTRTISGIELISTIVEDAGAGDYTSRARAIAEGGRIPIHAIKTTEQSVKFYKFGLGYKTSYEFQRRANLDILTPYAIRTQVEIEKSKVAQLTRMLINGDGIAYGAAPVVAQSSYNGKVNINAVNGTFSTRHFAAWLMERAEAGVPVDIVVGNWDMYLQWVLNFYIPTSNYGTSEADRLARAGVNVNVSKILDFDVQFKLSTTMPAGQLMGYTLGWTAEELIEAGSQITQSETSITTQEISYVRTENSGYKLVFGDTRSIFDITA